MNNLIKKRMMNGIKKYVLFTVFAGLILKAGAESKYVPVRPTDKYEGIAVNVRDFGAKGDGVTDDTEAIKAAVKAAFEKRRIPLHPQYGYFVSFSEVYFPNGHYIISDTIDINAVNIRGEAYAAIEQKDPEKDIFYNPDTWRQKIEGMTFLGGRIQLNLGNNNIDTGHVTVRDCHFKNSRDVAVTMRKGSNSTFFKVENCVFWNCMQAVISYCDMTVIEDCWISSCMDMKNKAVIENYGVMHIENILGVPLVRRDEGFSEEWIDPNGVKRIASNQRWVDNYGVLHIRNCRFGGEGGGFSAVYNFAKFQSQYPVIPNSITIESSYLYNAQSTAVVLKEIPNVITITNNHGLPDAWLLRVAPAINLDTYFDNEKYPQFPYKVRIDISNNYGGFGTGLPEQLWPYQINEIVAEKPPQKGNWERGQFIRNPNFEKYYDQQAGWVWVKTPAIEEPYGWLCIESGKPGKWQPVYYLSTPVKPQ